MVPHAMTICHNSSSGAALLIEVCSRPRLLPRYALEMLISHQTIISPKIPFPNEKRLHQAARFNEQVFFGVQRCRAAASRPNPVISPSRTDIRERGRGTNTAIYTSPALPTHQASLSPPVTKWGLWFVHLFVTSCRRLCAVLSNGFGKIKNKINKHWNWL